MRQFIFLSLISCCSIQASLNKDLDRLASITKQEKKEENQPYNLPNHDFRATDLNQAKKISFENSNFVKGNFSGTPHQPKVIKNINFSKCDLREADFSHTEITNCNFEGARLQGATFKASSIKYSGFNKAQLTGAHFDEGNLESVSFTSANLQCTSWENANAFRVSHDYADERGRAGNIQERDCSHSHSITSHLFSPFTCKVK